ncbi:hypothetical protein LMG33818_000520 [Halomonadaceae bacterium LMG 33818]|uniref:HNH endonuclease n=1 Tax=Cernens ardua TaxID=3402176 RepID=UPI003EDB8B55
MPRNKPWSRNELILALDLYFQEPQPKLDDSDPHVQRLSTLLNKFPLKQGEHRDASYRSASSVALKLQNIRSVASHKTAGRHNGGKLDKIVYDEFKNNPILLKQSAAAIKNAIHIDISRARVSSAESLDQTSTAYEGGTKYLLHKVYERNSAIIKQKKQAVLHAKGKLECEACGFNFHEIYGERGYGYIECHHTSPVSQLTSNDATTLSDLALLCANCHRMIHAREPWLSMEELKLLLRNTY